MPPGKKDDGWWTCDKLIGQMRGNIINGLNYLHPDEHTIFVFHNSMNHKKPPTNGLDAYNITLKVGGTNTLKNCAMVGMLMLMIYSQKSKRQKFLLN